MLLLIVLLALAILWILASIDDEAVALHLTIEGCMAKIGDSITARIAPTNLAGAAAPVFDVQWDDPGDAYDVSVSPDGLTATVVAKAAGSGVAVVSAKTKSGTNLVDSKPLPDVDAAPVDEEAVALNLTVEGA